MKNKDRRLALRFSLYIQALGAVPVVYQSQTLNAYVIELQQQYQELQQMLGPEVARAARVAGRTAIREQGFAHAATLFPISVPPVRKKSRKASAPAKSHSRNPPVRSSPSAPVAAAKRGLYNCRRKFVTLTSSPRRRTHDAYKTRACVSTHALSVTGFMSATRLA